MSNPGLGKEAFQTLSKALRVEVLDQVRAFRKEAFAPTGETDGRRWFICPVLGIRTGWADSHVDHHPPLTFGTLCVRWLEERGITASNVVVINRPEKDFSAELADRELARDWQAWHRSKANLRLVSSKANLGVIRRAHNAATRSVN